MADAKITFQWEEKPFEVLNLAVAVYVFGVDVSDHVVGQVTLTLNNRSGWNTCHFTLSNAEDVWVYSPEQALAIRKMLDANQNGRPDPLAFRLGALDYRYSEGGKYQVAAQKGGRLNTLDKAANTWRWEPHPGSTCFDKYDPIRVFAHHPRVAETDTDTPAWIPAFTGFLENRTMDDKHVTGGRLVQVSAHCVRYFAHRQRVDVSSWGGFHMGNRMFKISDTIFQDVRRASRVGHALERTSLEDAVQHLVVGGVTKTKPDPKNPDVLLPDGMPRRGAFTGLGYFKLGKIVQLNPAQSPVGAVKNQAEQLTGVAPSSGGIVKGNDATGVARERAIATARKNIEARNKALQEAQAKVAAERERVMSGNVTTGADLMAKKQSQDAVAAATRALRVAQGELAAALVAPDEAESAAAPPAVPSAPVSVIPELATDLGPDEISKLEAWYALGLFGDWEEEFKAVAQAQVLSALGDVIATVTPISGAVSAAVLAASRLVGQGRGNPATTTSSAAQQKEPERKAIVVPPGGEDEIAPTGNLSGLNPPPSAAAVRAATGAGAGVAGSGGTQNGPATHRALTWKEMDAIGRGTYWDGPFDPTAKKLYILIPKGGTGNKNFADQTSPQTLGWHDRHYISISEVINGFLGGIDYQWWVSGSGDVFVEPNMLDFQPDDFGAFAGVMKVDSHMIEGKLGDEHGDIPSIVQAVGAAQNPLAGGIATQGTRRGQAHSELLIRRFGIEVKVTTYDFIGDEKTLRAAAATDLQKAVAHANNMDLTFLHRPFLLPNKPLLHRIRHRLGTTSAVSHTWTIFGAAQTRAGIDHVRRKRFDGRYLLITGGYDAPVGGRRILPADTLNGPPRTGVRTDLDAQQDSSLGQKEAATASDLKNAQINSLVDAEKNAAQINPDPW